MFSVDVILKMDEIVLEPAEQVVQTIVLDTIKLCLEGIKRIKRWHHGSCLTMENEAANESEDDGGFYGDVVEVNMREMCLAFDFLLKTLAFFS